MPTPAFDVIDLNSNAFVAVENVEATPIFSPVELTGIGLIVFGYRGLGDEILGTPCLGGASTIVGTADFTAIDWRG